MLNALIAALILLACGTLLLWVNRETEAKSISGRSNKKGPAIFR